MSAAPNQSSFFQNLKGRFGLSQSDEESANRKRMEAFLSALPLEYCGWSSDGMVAYSRGFCELLGLDIIHKIADIQDVLTAKDAAALDSHFLELRKHGEGFSIIAKVDKQSRVLRISGGLGQDVAASQSYHILWLDDVTDQVKSKEALQSHLDAVEKNHDRMDGLLKALPLPIWMYNDRQELIWCNAPYADALGVSPDAATEQQKHWGLNLGKDVGKITTRKLARDTDNAKEPQTARGRIVVGGARKTYNVESFPLTLPDQPLTGGYALDLTTEDELRSEIERYQSANTKLLEQFSTAIAIFSANEHLEFYNSSFSELWGLEDKWLNGCPKLGDVMEKLREDRKLPEQADFKSFKKGWIKMFTSLLHPHEDMLHLPDGRALRIMFAPHPMGGLMITFDDVTSRLELESSYNTLIAVQRETLDNLAEGVAVFGSDGRLKLWNPPYQKLWNFMDKTLQDEPHITALADKMKRFFNKKKMKHAQRHITDQDDDDNQELTALEKAEWDDIQRILTANGLERKDNKDMILRSDGVYIEISQVALPDGGVMMTYRNVTDTMRVERALREKAAALEEAEKLKMDFLANVSYQLRTPLNAIMGFAEILTNEYFGELNDRQKEYSGGIAEAGTRLMSLIDNILDLSTIEAGYLTLTREPINVHSIMQDIYNLTHDWAGKETLHVRIDCPEDIGMILADERRIKQALLNLVRNAISFTPGGGNINLIAKIHNPTGQKGADKVIMSVQDTGIGIPEDDQIKIFQPFERADGDRHTDTHQDSAEETAVKQQQGGPGLGLSLVKNIVDMHGGDVLIDSRLGEGTTISIVMPLYEEE